jgi:hypothetical protein
MHRRFSLSASSPALSEGLKTRDPAAPLFGDAPRNLYFREEHYASAGIQFEGGAQEEDWLSDLLIMIDEAGAGTENASHGDTEITPLHMHHGYGIWNILIRIYNCICINTTLFNITITVSDSVQHIEFSLIGV